MFVSYGGACIREQHIHRATSGHVIFGLLTATSCNDSWSLGCPQMPSAFPASATAIPLVRNRDLFFFFFVWHWPPDEKAARIADGVCLALWKGCIDIYFQLSLDSSVSFIHDYGLSGNCCRWLMSLNSAVHSGRDLIGDDMYPYVHIFNAYVMWWLISDSGYKFIKKDYLNLCDVFCFGEVASCESWIYFFSNFW